MIIQSKKIPAVAIRKLCLTIGIVLTMAIKLLGQNKEIVATKDSTGIYSNTTFELKIEHYNFRDTIQDDFAAYLIKSSMESHKIRMAELKETAMPANNPNEKPLFRVISLPTFDHPVAFTITEKNNQFYLKWTIGKGAGGYEPKGIKRTGKIKLQEKDWEYFKQLIDLNSLDTMPLVSYLPMSDGTSWIIEKDLNNSYKIHFTNFLQEKKKIGFALLAHLSKVKNKEPIYYQEYPAINLFDKNNKLVALEPVRKMILKQLNHDFQNKLLDKDYCFHCGIFVKINANGKLMAVRNIPYVLPHQSLSDRLEYYEENFLDRKFRKEVKRSLSKLDFPDLNLPQSVWLPIFIKYNKDKNKLE